MEDAAEQLAVWILADSMSDVPNSQGERIRSRVTELVAESLQAATRWTPSGYAQSYEVSVANQDAHTNTLRFIPKITAVPPVALTNALFAVESDNINQDRFSVTANRSGVGPTIGLRESTSSQTDTLRADIILDPGVVFSSSSGILVTAQTVSISRTQPVTVPAASLERAGSLFGASLASNLTPAGKGVYWAAVAAASALGLVALIRLLAKLAELFNIKASGDPRDVRRRRWIFFGACSLFGLVLLPFAYFFVKTEFVAYGYTRPVDPHPNQAMTRLQPTETWATSCFEPDALTYFPANVTDGDDASAWVSARDKGAGSLIAFDFKQVVAIDRLSIWNGVQGHGANFYTNGRVTTLQLLSDGGWEQVVFLDPDQLGEQVFDVPDLSPIVTRYLVLRVGGLNDTYLDAALTEVTFYGHTRPSTTRPGGISVDPAGLRITRQADASAANAPCHQR